MEAAALSGQHRRPAASLSLPPCRDSQRLDHAGSSCHGRLARHVNGRPLPGHWQLATSTGRPRPSRHWHLTELRCIKFRLVSRVYQSRLSPLPVEDRCPSPDCGAVHPRARRGGRHPPLLCGDSANGTASASASESRARPGGWRSLWARGLLGAFLGGRPRRRRRPSHATGSLSVTGAVRGGSLVPMPL